MRYEAINSGPPLTVDRLDAYSREHRLEVPQPLREQLLSQNGGAFLEDVSVRIGDDGREEEVVGLFGIDMSDRSSELWWNVATFAGRVPTGSVPFADDPAGNLFLLDERGQVLFWDHEREGEADATEFVAPSLAGFLDGLLT